MVRSTWVRRRAVTGAGELIAWPRGWVRARRRRTRVATALWLAVAVTFGSAMVAFRAGQYELSFAGSMVSFLLASAAVFGQATTRPDRVGDDRDVRSIPVDRGADRAVLLARRRSTALARMVPLAAIPVAGGAVLVAVREHVLTALEPATAAVATVFAVGALIPLVIGAYRTVVRLSASGRRRPMGIGLSPRGVYHWGWFGTCFFAWGWISSVGSGDPGRLRVRLYVAEPDREPNAEENRIGRIALYRDYSERLTSHVCAVNPAVVYYALAFYHRHPELRGELADHRGVDRIRAADFPEILDEVERYGDLRPGALAA